MQCVILAGGMGTRMRSISPKLPKSLIPVRNRPFLHYQLSHLAKQKIQSVLLCVGYGGDQIKRYAEDGRAWGLTIQYVKEGTDLRGTGGALRLAFEQDKLESTFFVLSGDSFLPIDFLPAWDFFETRTEPALKVVYKKENASSQGHALFDGQKISQYDMIHPSSEMTHRETGLSILRNSTIEQNIPPKTAYSLDDLFHKLSERGRLAGMEILTHPHDIGSPEGLDEFTAKAPGYSL
jgi:NDP-sugar pyrophosphorylase family protein